VTRRPLSRSKVKVTGPLWLAELAGQHGHQEGDGVYDVYRVTTCRPVQGHIVTTACVISRYARSILVWYFWQRFSQYLAYPHIPTMPVNDCLTSQLQSHVMSIDCSLVCVHLVLVCWWWWFDWSSCSCHHHLSRSNKVQNGDILVPADPGLSG